MFHMIRWTTFALLLLGGMTVHAQITGPRTVSARADRLATLEEQLVNRLKATKNDQRGYLKFVVKQVQDGKLDARLVVAIERYAIRRSSHFPFPFFERALKFEANRRGIAVPNVQQFASTKNLTPGDN